MERRWKGMLVIGCIYGMLSILAYAVIYMKHVTPLPANSSKLLFSEGRALTHLSHLSETIGIRQEGSPGLLEAAKYIKAQLEDHASRGSNSVRVEVDESSVTGSFNMLFLGHSISLAYRNHTNILIRISSADAKPDDAAVLVNGHFDSALGSPGAGDCGSCVASMLEVVRVLIDSEWVPPNPVIFLFNGAEELFLLASHGFMKSHKWRDTIGAFINVEATGTGGVDLMCQSGPGSWPSKVYAKSAIYPMAHSAAQDIFPLIPGDTDYRIFSEDYGNIPGLDIIFLIGGYFYHTSYDKLENIIPGSIQARGENLVSLLKAFSGSSVLMDNKQRANFKLGVNQTSEDRPIFFDYLSWFMVLYSKNTAWILYILPVLIVFIAPFLFEDLKFEFMFWFQSVLLISKGMLWHMLALVLGVIVPALCAFLRVLVSRSAMNWYAHPWLALLMFVPAALVGLLLPNIIWKTMNESNKGIPHFTDHWASVAFNAAVPLVFLVFGRGGAFLHFIWAISLIISWPIFLKCVKFFGKQSLRTLLGYIFPLIVPMALSLYISGVSLQFLIEKMGMFGSIPEPYGYFVSDIIIASITGIAVGWCVGPVLPFIVSWLLNAIPVKLLIQLCVIAMAISSQFFPYSTNAPKRLVVQHTFQTTGNRILEASYSLAVTDANRLSFILENAPKVAKELNVKETFHRVSANISDDNTWLALYPIGRLVSQKFKFPATDDNITRYYPRLPCIHLVRESRYKSRIRRVHLELDLGSLQEVWVAALNISGPLSNWSFSEHQLPVPEQVGDGPPCYILRLSGSSSINWEFWLEANSSDALRIDMAVLDQHLHEQTIKLRESFPPWVDVIAFSSFLSSYVF